MPGQPTTEMLTPRQMQERADSLTRQAERLREQSQQIEIGESHVKPTQKSISVSKTIINISYIAFGLTGIVGSFWGAFDMSKYVSFLETFALIWAPLVVAVGGGRAFKNFVNRKYGDEHPVQP